MPQVSSLENLKAVWQEHQLILFGLCPVYLVLSYLSWSIKYKQQSSQLVRRPNNSPIYVKYVINFEDECIVKVIDRLLRVVEVSRSWLMLRIL